MSTLLRVDSSFRTQGSHSRAVADSLQAAWLEEHAAGAVVKRDLGVSPLSAAAWGNALMSRFTPEESRTTEQLEGVALAATLADEILGADALLLASPLYNFGVNQFVKVWFDLLISDPRLGPGSTELAGKPAFLVTVMGGSYADGTPRAGWDHSTGFLVRILADNFGMDVSTVMVEMAMAPINPALAQFIPMHEQSLAAAHTQAATLGKALAGRAA